MLTPIFIITAHLCSSGLSQSVSSDFQYIGQILTEYPSFVELIDLASSGSDDPLDLDLVVTNFEAKGTNGVTAFENIGLQLKNISDGINPPKSVLVNETLQWYIYSIYLSISIAQK